jgi:putative protease
MPLKKKKAIKSRSKIKKTTKKTKKTASKQKKIKKQTSKKNLIKNKIIGSITHYFPHVKAAVLKVKTPVIIGEEIWIKGHTSDFKEKISSMQIDHKPILKAKKGDEIGLMVENRVRRGDVIYKV